MAAEKSEAPAQNKLFDPSGLNKDLGQRAVRGGAITIFAQAIRFILRTGSTAILARLLSPDDFGLIAMVTVIVEFTNILNNAGLAAATVQRKQITHDQVSALFWANLAISTLLMSVVAACSPLISWFYHEPRLVGVSIALSVAIFFGGLSLQHQALLRRAMRFGVLAVIDFGSIFLSIIVAIAMAYWGYGYWALVGMTVTSSIVTTLLSFLMSGWIPSLPVRGSGAGEMFQFGIGVSSFAIIKFFSRNCDNVLIGWRWGAGPLGIYSKAYGLLLLPTAQISNPAMSAFMPMLCRLHDQPEKFRVTYKQIIRAISFLTMPGVASLIVAADAAVLFFLGPQWKTAVPVFQILGFAAIFESVFSSLHVPLVACGRSSAFLRMGLIVALPTIPAFVIGLPFGPKGVAAGYTIANTLIVCPLLFTFIAGQTPIKVMDFYRAIFSPLLAAIVVASVLFVIRWAFDIQTPLYVLCVAAICILPTSIVSIHLFQQIRNVRHD